MKKVIPDLLLALEFFIHVCEVTASPIYYVVDSSQPLPHIITKDENEIVLDYMGMDIYVTRKSFPGNIHVPVKCIFPEEKGYPKLHGIPDINTKPNFNFTTIPLYSLIDGVRYCVAYVKEHGELLGVQAPPTDFIADPKRYTGDPKNLSPDKNKYYLTYLSWDFVVYHKEGDLLSLTDVKLFPINKPNSDYKSPGNISRFHIRVVKIECAGITFFAARIHKKPQSADLVLNNTLVIFEAAWLHPESIPPLLQQMMTEEQRVAWRKLKEINPSSTSYVASSSRPLSYARDSVKNDIVIGIMGILIDVTRKYFSGDIHVPLSCTVRQEKSYPRVLGIPDRNTKQNYNLTTRPVFSGKVRYCVLYVTEYGQILGVKVPPSEYDSRPDRYRGWDFVVYHDEGNLLSLKEVKLYPKYKEDDNLYPRLITTYATTAVEINCAGVKFFASRRHRQNPTSPLVFNNSLVIFEAAWLHAKDIPKVLLRFVPPEQLNIWFPAQKKLRLS